MLGAKQQLRIAYHNAAKLDHLGMIALEITRLSNPDIKQFRNFSCREIAAVLERHLDDCSCQHEPLPQWDQDAKALALILHVSVLASFSNGMGVANCTQCAVVHAGRLSVGSEYRRGGCERVFYSGASALDTLVQMSTTATNYCARTRLPRPFQAVRKCWDPVPGARGRTRTRKPRALILPQVSEFGIRSYPQTYPQAARSRASNLLDLGKQCDAQYKALVHRLKGQTTVALCCRRLSVSISPTACDTLGALSCADSTG